jgi:hypothetical protein
MGGSLPIAALPLNPTVSPRVKVMAGSPQLGKYAGAPGQPAESQYGARRGGWQ